MDTTTSQTPAVTPERILHMAWGFAPPIAIAAAVKTQMFDRLDGGPLTAESLAAATGNSARGVSAVADLLVSLGLLSKASGGEYALTPEAKAFLVKGKPGYLGASLERALQDLIPTWLHLPETVRSGEPVHAVETQQGGSAFFERLVEGLFNMNFAAASVLAAALLPNEPKGLVRVLDLAAGSGVWGFALAQRSPQVRVTAVDWENVLGVTRRTAARLGLTDRLETIGGDIQQVDFGTGYDVAILGHILHSEGAERSRNLLRRVHDALRPDGRIAIAEFLVNEERTGPTQGTIFNINMLVHTSNGQTFTENELRRMLEESGFRDAETIPAPAPSPLLVATRV